MDREAETANEELSQAIYTQVAGKLPPDVVRELCTGQALETLRGMDAQEKLNTGTEARMTEGLGQLRIRVTDNVYWAAMRDPRNRAEYGPNPWKNPKFVEKAWQKYPQIRVAARKKAGIVRPAGGFPAAAAESHGPKIKPSEEKMLVG